VDTEVNQCRWEALNIALEQAQDPDRPVACREFSLRVAVEIVQFFDDIDNYCNALEHIGKAAFALKQSTH